ncbi:MAG: VWA domain-containing protein [Candidatus Lokiarchaeota archaeon]|nr:VWA domain-containing protein [Candidatus Lokiarchaeota archaeon]
MNNSNFRRQNYFFRKNKANKFLLGIMIGLIISLAFFLNVSVSTQVKQSDFHEINTSATAGPVNSPNNLFQIMYNTDNVTLAEVQNFGQVLEDAYNIHQSWGIPDIMDPGNNPNGAGAMGGNSKPPLFVNVTTGTGLNAWAWYYIGFDDQYSWITVLPRLISSGYAWDEEPFYIGAHEMFHCAQYEAPGSPPKDWVLEGQARMQQDKLSTVTDGLDGTEFASYLGDVRSYLQNTHDDGLTTISYSGCLFWNYFCEQFGDNQTDPWNGIDAVVTFWDNTVNPSGTDGITMINNALDELSPGKTFKEVFEDFSVAIYAKDMDETTIPSKWSFEDDDAGDASANYFSVSKEISSTLLPGTPLTDGYETINSWANKYYEADIDPTVEAITIQFNQTTNHKLFYALLAMDGDDVDYYYTTESKDFTRAIVNNNYDKIVVIVAGLEDSATYKYAIEGSSPTLNIESPDSTPASAQARVGAHDDPEKFLAIVDVSYRKTAPVHGFLTENFQAQVGGIDATVLSATDVYGKYFLLIQPPNQSSNGLYNLKVTLVDTDGTVLDQATKESCVMYNETFYDLMVSIDKSGSMGSKGKLDAAKSAGKLFVNSFLSEDLLGVVEFHTTANLIHNLLALTTTNRNNAINAIDGISVGSLTSIGDALLKSQNELYLDGVTDNPNHIVLISDGKNTYGLDVDDVKGLITNNNTIVHAITIGGDAAYTVMQDLAADTGGTYFHCFDPASGDIPNDLAEIYRAISEEVRFLERFYHSRGTIPTSSNRRFYLDVTDDMDYIEFTVHYNGTTEPSITLLDPYDTPVSFTRENYKDGMGHAIYKKHTPDSGQWEIQISENGGSDLKYFVEGAAHTSISMELMTPPNGITSSGWSNSEIIGTPIPFLVSLTDEGPIPNATVRVRVTPPGAGGPNKTHDEIFEIPLCDDGNHADGYADDGVYGGLYTPTSEEGSYQFMINATGKTKDDEDFTRIRTGAFTMIDPREKPDSDQDGLPDNWEEYYGLDPYDDSDPHNATGDPDQDGLSNEDEFFYGTDPLNGDTDYGGEADKSEVMDDRNPLDPADDTIGRFPSIRVYPGNGHIYFLLPNSTQFPEFKDVEIYRSTDPIFDYKHIDTINMTDVEFNDTSVSNYEDYYYRFKGLSTTTANGISKYYHAMPKENVLGPEGCLIINGGNKTTESNGIELTIYQVPNDITIKNAFPATHMRISNTPGGLEDSPWISFTENISWIVPKGEGLKFVYVQLRDDQTVPAVGVPFSAGIYYTGEETVGPETAITLFLIFFDILIISVIYYKKKKPNFGNLKF